LKNVGVGALGDPNNDEEQFLKGKYTESEGLLYKFVRNRQGENVEEKAIKRTIADYISGQTDKYFLSQCEEFIPGFDSEKLYK